MYNVNTGKIEHILTYLDDHLLPQLKTVMNAPKETLLAHSVEGYAAERMFHLFIESMTDVGNLLIDGFIMRDPGSYEDIVDIMEDEGVYPPQTATVYREIVRLRKSLVTEYTMNIHEQLYDVYHQSHEMMEQYATYIREYLKKELW